jgi:Putative F0F1-ATPase subunit Ca2+/Mg2+ transporter
VDGDPSPSPSGDESDRGAEGDRRASPNGPGLWALAGLGLTVGVSMALFVGGGLWLDSVTGRSPLFALVGVFVGILAAVGLSYLEIRPYL